jgi:hypothetical protein
MRFDSDGICILSSITTRDECDAYLTFLTEDERQAALVQLSSSGW